MTKTELSTRIQHLEHTSAYATHAGISEGLLRAAQYCEQETCRTANPAELAKELRKMAAAHHP